MYKLSRNLVMGGAILLFSLLSSCSDDKDKKMVVCWGDSLTASHTNVGGNGIKQFLKELPLWATTVTLECCKIF